MQIGIERFKLVKRITRRHLLMGLPLAAVIGASFLPFGRRFEQFLILFTLMWFQFSLLFGSLR